MGSRHIRYAIWDRDTRYEPDMGSRDVAEQLGK